METLYSTIYYSKYFIELNFDKSTQYVALWTHKRASFGVSFMSTSTEIDRVIKGFYCICVIQQSNNALDDGMETGRDVKQCWLIYKCCLSNVRYFVPASVCYRSTYYKTTSPKKFLIVIKAAGIVNADIIQSLLTGPKRISIYDWSIVFIPQQKDEAFIAFSCFERNISSIVNVLQSLCIILDIMVKFYSTS